MPDASRRRTTFTILTLVASGLALVVAATPSAQATGWAGIHQGHQGPDVVSAQSYALPLPHDALPRSEYDDPHHDYPAIDLPVPEGTEAYAVTSGDAVVFSDASCGNGVQIAGSDGATYTYCHFSQHAISDGPVAPGQLIGLTGNTGNSTGPHLHFQIRTSDDLLRCPQEMLLAVYDGAAPPAPAELPTSGCSYTTSRPATPLGPA